MSEKRLLTILLFFAIALAGVYFGAELIMSGFSGTPGEQLSFDEWKLARRLKRDCKCRVKIYHGSEAVDESIAGSTVHLSFSWKTKAGTIKDTAHNMVLKEDSVITRFSNEVVEKLISIGSVRERYKTILISLKDEDMYGGQMPKDVLIEYSVTPGGKTELLYLNRY